MFFPRITCSLLLVLSLALSLDATPNPASAPHKENVLGKESAPGKEVVRGYLVDLVCVREEAGKIPDLGPNHTRKCLQMPACVQGGYAVLLPSNQVLAFDQHGNELAQKWLASRHQEKRIVIKAIGSRDGNTFRVLRIE